MSARMSNQARKLKSQVKIYDDEYYIRLFQEMLDGKRKKLHYFWNKEVGKVIMRYVLFDILEWNRDDICQNFVKHKIVKRYKLSGATREFSNSNFELLSYSVPELELQRWELVGGTVGSTYWRDDNNKRFALQWFIDKMIENGELECINNIPKIVEQKTFDRYRIRGLVANYFSDSTFQTFDFLYPGKFKKWEFFNMVGLTKEETIESIRWLFIDKLEVDIHEIPNIARDSLFEEHKLMSGITKYFRSYKNAIIEAFPEENFYHWNFRQIEQGFWLNPKNRVVIMKGFIENELKIKKEEIPKYINHEYLSINNGVKFMVACNRYYNSSYAKWINECYPNLYTEEEYNRLAFDHRPSKEFDSLGEFELFNFFKESTELKVTYCGRSREYIVKNDKNGESYIPDFLLNDDIICEYYGFYTSRPTTQYFKDYIAKTHRKNEFYNNYCLENNMYFLELYADDLKDDFQGVKEKLELLKL